MHTKGPWTIEDGGDWQYVVADDGIVAETQQETNARLIAAAPDLLEALKSALAVGQIVGQSKMVALAAVAKAEGRGE